MTSFVSVVVFLAFWMGEWTDTSGFNIDTVHPLIYEDPHILKGSSFTRQSYFGYSIQFLFGQKDSSDPVDRKWLLVGAPRGNSSIPTHRSLKEPGRVDRCILGRLGIEDCQQLVIDNTAEENSNNYPERYVKERKDFGWLGGAIAVDNPSTGRVAICGHRWTNQINREEHKMNGVCYWSGHQVPEHADFNKTLPLVDDSLQVTSNGTYNYAFGQAGFSVHVTKRSDRKEMIIGAPGVYGWTGAVIRMSDLILGDSPTGIPTRRRRRQSSKGAKRVVDFGLSLVSNATQIPQLKPNDYFGYSVHSGMFFGVNQVSYVSGAPRAANMNGKVILFDFVASTSNSQQLLNVRLELEGSQLGEYFGATVLAIDVNGDGLDELLVGAPQHSLNLRKESSTSSRSSGDEGKVYLYLNRNGAMNSLALELEGGRAHGSRFGTSLASMGDVNLDGFNDVVVGAPYEDGRGAVYLYLGGPEGLLLQPETGYWQRIAASDFPIPAGLKGFGISLAASDIDDNRYPDLAIGSYLSGHVVILRSRPVLQFNLSINTTQGSNLIQPTGGSFVDIMACVQVQQPRAGMPETCLSLAFFFDAGYLNQPRLTLLKDSHEGRTSRIQDPIRQPYTYVERFLSSGHKCRSFQLSVSSSDQDFSRPAIFRLDGRLLTSQCQDVESDKLPGSQYVIIPNSLKKNDSFCSNCPVADRRRRSTVESALAFTDECGEDGICREDIDVQAHFVPNIKNFVIGSSPSLIFKVGITNEGEPAYLLKLEIQLSGQTRLIQQQRGDACGLPSLIDSFSNSSDPNGGNLKYYCNLNVNPLRGPTTHWMEYQLDVTSLQNGFAGEFLTVTIEARIGTAVPAFGSRPKFVLNLPLKTAVDLEVVGNPEEVHQTYQRPNGTDAANARQGRISFQHTYEVRNVLPTAVGRIEMEVLVPISSNGMPLLEALSVQASQKGRPFNNINCSREDRTIRSLIDAIRSIEPDPPSPKYAQANRTAFIDCVSPVKNEAGKEHFLSCARFICSAGPLSKETPITLTLDGTVLLLSILELIGKKDVFILSTAARVTSKNGVAQVQQPAENRPDGARASTHFLPQGPPEAVVVAGWIITLAVLAGLALLTALAYLLYKVGFFQRKRYPQERDDNNKLESDDDDPVDLRRVPNDPSSSASSDEPL